MSLIAKIATYRRLGTKNLIQVLWYTLRLKSGWLKRTMPVEKAIGGPFFNELGEAELDKLSSTLKNLSLMSNPQVLGWYTLPVESIPDWSRSILTDKSMSDTRLHWTEITDFTSGIGDIKGVWELSRFNWSLLLTQTYLKYKDPSYLEKLNQWLEDWSEHNPVNQGPNWKCAQETSLRILHLSACALIMQQFQPTEAMQKLLSQHLRRVYPTLGYAMAQDNNHGTSEAAALYIGGSWLLQANPDNPEATKWFNYGQQYLVERVLKLVMEDGSFSQYSVNYHRLMLDTLSMVELWRKALNLSQFSSQYIERAGKAANWLFQLTDRDTGDAPNLGANDGAHIVNFTNASYRDFRASVELAAQLFLQKTAYSDALSKQLRNWFGLNATICLEQKGKFKFGEGGYGLVRSEDAFCFIRVPKFRFRPGNADCLHLDFWLKGVNVFRDGGSFSYNTEPEWLNYFSGAASHNTIQFDDREQMPKISRFLFGRWLHYTHFDISDGNLAASYTDWLGASHSRHVTLSKDQLKITDIVSGFSSKAVLRWRLANLDWQISENILKSENFTLQVTSDQNLKSIALAEGFESRYYGQKSSLPVLEVEVVGDAEIITTISWQ